MAVPPVLVVTMTFDPPVIQLVGPVPEATIAKLNDYLPHLTLNSALGRKSLPKFVRATEPVPHWVMELLGLISDDPSKMAMMLAVLDGLEEEGGWSMHDAHSSNNEFEEVHKFFFVKKSR